MLLIFYLYITHFNTFVEIFVMPAQNLLTSRKHREAKSEPRKRYKRYLPAHKNKIAAWIFKNKPELLLPDQDSQSIHPDLKARLKKAFISPVLFKRIIKNEAIFSFDDFISIAICIDANPKDLL